MRNHLRRELRQEYPEVKFRITKRAILTSRWDPKALRVTRAGAIRLAKAENKRTAVPPLCSFYLEAFTLMFVERGMDQASALLALWEEGARDLRRRLTPDPAGSPSPSRSLTDPRRSSGWSSPPTSSRRPWTMMTMRPRCGRPSPPVARLHPRTARRGQQGPDRGDVAPALQPGHQRHRDEYPPQGGRPAPARGRGGPLHAGGAGPSGQPDPMVGSPAGLAAATKLCCGQPRPESASPTGGPAGGPGQHWRGAAARRRW